jgi:UPF0755 protein
MKNLFKLFIALCFIGISAAFAGCAWFYWFAQSPLPLSAPAVTFEIRAGMGLRAAGEEIARSGVDLSAGQLVILGRLLRQDRQIKAGNYEIKQGTTALRLLGMLTAGEGSRVELRLIEGQSWRQWRALIENHPQLRPELRGRDDAQIAALLGINGPSPEGALYPDTYMVDVGGSPLQVLARAAAAMRKKRDAAWAARDQGLPLRSPEEALILASVVEKETGQPQDRPKVAAVLINRLKIGMRLQSDPTVIYGLGAQFDGNLRKVDLQTDTPYNTYTRTGLPPTPICMPSLAALEATLHPADLSALYFVGRGDGSSVFSDSLTAHNQAVNLYQRRLAPPTP